MTTDAAGTPRILGTLRAADGQGVVRMEDRLDRDIDDVWSAIAEPDCRARWLGEVEGDLRPGGEFRAHFSATGWEGTGRIEACEPPHHVVVRTKDADEPGDAYEHAIEVTLAADGEHTLLAWEERGMPADLLAEYAAGIQIHIEDLAAYLAGDERVDAKTRWQELVAPYRELAAAVGG